MTLRPLFRLPLLILLLSGSLFANGVAVINASTGVYARLKGSGVTVSVDDQVAVVTTTQVFKNTLGTEQTVKYAFPLPEGASAVKLRWFIGGTWTTASFSSSPQDTSLPGGGGTVAASLKTYLGATPLYFGITQKLQPDSLLIVELTYVQLLPYRNGTVSFFCPNDYRLIQTASVDSQSFAVSITSQRTIDSVTAVSPAGTAAANNGLAATLTWKKAEGAADADYRFRYALASTELGLFGMSTKLPDSLGYFAFIAEPNPAAGADVLKKVFTLIIDRSGSMYGDKMVQARNAAAFIVNNLNEGDRFNLIDFDDIITPFRPKHVLYAPPTRDSALQYVQTLEARGMTNISGAFEAAIPQFALTADSATANIIIFFTDGQATAGLTGTEQILGKVQTLVTALERKISIFTFGIGSDANGQLLSLLASQNNGMAEFLGSDQLEARITDFYLRIRHPVLVNTSMVIASENVREVYPNPLPNLYKGEQMLVAGVYSPAPPLGITLNGTAFGKPVSYQYQLTLSDTAVPKNQFLPKLWAKKKIEHLLVKYYNLPSGSLQADTLKKQIVALSVSYGVMSPFTSFTNPGNASAVREHGGRTVAVPADFVIDGNFPNPFNPTTVIRFTVTAEVKRIVRIRIYNALGQLVDELAVPVNGAGSYEVLWNARGVRGPLSSGVYVAVLDAGDRLVAHRMMLMK